MSSACFMPYGDSTKPGRRDVNGNEWWACDPYPTWFRWHNGKLEVNHAEWVDPPEGRDEQPKYVKQVIVMRTDLGMRKGKMIAQGAHASIAFLSRMYRDEWRTLTEAQDAWLMGSFTKVCVRVDSEEELLGIYETARAANIPADLITDAGKTEFGGVPTRTCLAIGPHWSSAIDEVTGHLKLL